MGKSPATPKIFLLLFITGFVFEHKIVFSLSVSPTVSSVTVVLIEQMAAQSCNTTQSLHVDELCMCEACFTDHCLLSMKQRWSSLMDLYVQELLEHICITYAPQPLLCRVFSALLRQSSASNRYLLSPDKPRHYCSTLASCWRAVN